MSHDPVYDEILPRLDRNDPLVLTVFLGHLFRDEEKSSEMRRVAYNHMQFAYGGQWPRFVLLQDLDKDEYGNDGTLTDIYLASQAAKSAGWKAVTFLDALSWRQHTRSTRFGEDPTLTAIVVDLECAPRESVSESTFFIRRLPIMMALCEAKLAISKKFKDWNQISPQPPGPVPTMSVKMYYGFYLRDPSAPPFGDDSEYQNLPKLRQQVLNLRPRLPQELKLQIEYYIRQDSALADLIDAHWRPPIAENLRLVQCLVQIDDQDIIAIENCARRLDGDHGPIEVLRWKGKQCASRREVARVMRHFAELGHSATIFVLDRPRPGHFENDPPIVNLIQASWAPVYPSTLRRGEAESLNEQQERIGKTGEIGDPEWNSRELSKEFELLLDPTWTFPRTQPIWGNQGHVYDVSSWNWPVFCLTNALTEDEKGSIMEELQICTDHELEQPKTYNFVPWLSESDGGPEDMLCFLRMCQRDKTVHENHRSLIFIDRDSPKDMKVIVCTGHYVYKHGESGMDYGRLAGREVACCIVNESVAYVSLVQYLKGQREEIHFFPDADYDGPLHNPDECGRCVVEQRE